MYTQLGILLSVGVLFLASVGGFLIPFLRKKTQEVSLLPFSWGCAILFTVALLLQQGVSLWFGVSTLFPKEWAVFFLMLAGLAGMPMLLGKSLVKQSACLFALCFMALFILPSPLFGLTAWWSDALVRVMLAGVWTFFILLFTETDRVPMESYILSMAFFLLFLLMSIGIFGIFPVGLFSFFATVLTLILVSLILYKKVGFFWMGFPMIFAVMFIAGYFFMRLAVMPNGAYVLIMLGYPIMEGVIAGALNLYRYRQLFPLQVPFLTERAFSLQLSVKKVFQKVFYAILLTGIIGMLGMQSSMQYFGVSLAMAVIILYGLFIGFTRNPTKVSFKNLGKDAQNGWRTLMQEIKTFPLKQAQQKEMPSALQTAPDEATSQSEQSGYGVASGKKVRAVSSEQTGEQSANAFIAPSRKAVATHLKSARSAQKKPAQTRQRKKQTINTQQSRATKKAK